MDSIKPLSHSNSFWGKWIPLWPCPLWLPRLNILLATDSVSMALYKGFMTSSFILSLGERDFIALAVFHQHIVLASSAKWIAYVASGTTWLYLLRLSKGPGPQWLVLLVITFLENHTESPCILFLMNTVARVTLKMGAILRLSYHLSNLIPATAVWGRHYCVHFVDEDTESWMVE